jgi:hypothetical protein
MKPVRPAEGVLRGEGLPNEREIEKAVARPSAFFEAAVRRATLQFVAPVADLGLA